MNFAEILNRFRQGNGTAHSHMKNLIEMAAVDGNFDDVEYNLLKSIAQQNGISEAQLKEIRKNPSGIKFEVPADKAEKFHQFYDLVAMMAADNVVHQDEHSLCFLFGVKFGYSRNNINELIAAVRANIKNGKNYTDTLKRVEMMVAEAPAAVSK